MSAHRTGSRAVRLGILIVAILAAGAVSAGSKSETSWSVEVPLEAGQAIRLENLVGSIHVKGGKRADAFRVDARVQVDAKSEDDVRILSEAIQPHSWSDADVAGLRVEVPVLQYPELRLATSRKSTTAAVASPSARIARCLRWPSTWR